MSVEEYQEMNKTVDDKQRLLTCISEDADHRWIDVTHACFRLCVVVGQVLEVGGRICRRFLDGTIHFGVTKIDLFIFIVGIYEYRMLRTVRRMIAKELGNSQVCVDTRSRKCVALGALRGLNSRIV